MQKEDKERVIAELTERLRLAETIIVADYRGLTMTQIDALRGRLIEHGARFQVVKNTLTRRAAEAAGAEAVLALLEGPTAIAFVEADGDVVAVAKALADSAKETKVLEIRGGVMQGRVISSEDVETLSTLPSLEALRGQVIGVILAPLNQLLALVTAPLQGLYGLIDARIEQLEAQGDTSAAGISEPLAAEVEAVEAEAPEVEAATGAEVVAEESAEEPAADAQPVAEAETVTNEDQEA
jgi:large subunit ribosomal protein L10